MNRRPQDSKADKAVLRWSSAFKILFLLIVIVGVMAVGSLAAFAIAAIEKSPEVDVHNIRALISETSEIYDKDDEPVEKLVQNEFKDYVSLDKIPKSVQQAAIAIEDERFYQHNGVDFRRLGSSMWENIRAKDFSSGASTITMQVAKNLFTTQEKSIERKLKDIYYSFQMESNLSKDQILEAYLNSASFSKGAVGIQAAAKTFFDKDASELSLAEGAMIVGITNRPSTYTPYNMVPVDENADLENINLILLPTSTTNEESTDEEKEIGQQLADLGRIDNFDLQQVQKGEILLRTTQENPKAKERQELILRQMLKLGMIDADTEEAARNEDIQIKLGETRTKGISSYYVDAVKDEVLEILEEKGHSKEEAQNLLYNGGLKIHTSLNLDMQKDLENRVNDNRYFPGRHYDENGIIQPQVGVVILDQHTGSVAAIVGGRGIGGNNILNRAKNPRQPGSSIKPIGPYLTLLNNNGTAGDVFRDLPLTSGPYRPKNSTGYQGYTTVRRLLIKSSNVGAYLVGKSLDPDADKANVMMANTLQSMGVTSIITTDDNPKYNDINFSSMTLGGMTYGISPLQMAGAFATLANEGNYIKPSFVDSIEDMSGEELYKNAHEEKQITSPQNAFILTNILEDVVRRGTGTYANISGMHEAGKTGTTNDKKDSWFVGYTPYYTGSVWIGNDDSTPLADHSRMAARLWRAIMTDVHEDLEDKAFDQPEDGLYTRYLPGAGYREYFADDTAPSRLKDLYKNVKPKPKPKPKETNDSDDSSSSGSSSSSNNNDNNNNND
ncbi:transglycosylase domain-containing protein [Peptoniphilus sp. KCTC 25270]|uniref:transglycosylase domain-containing protein n=1 Tax=Peptoniphilus sp. KCTC 25270 TaxID=2897414 RepID=UPI001E5CACAA|nr:transglycosylase domain-containing protein [Peptoniphilus sp. KCTC 25270]MCD1147278.1 transglycosylase domain-containing protein [Peptoniphilus sp. KCTC 25270]